jgi:hypothetical protein
MDRDADTVMIDDDQGGADSSRNLSPITEEEQKVEDTFKSTVTIEEEDDDVVPDSDQELDTVKVIEFETEVQTERKSTRVKRFKATVHVLRFTPQVSENIIKKMNRLEFVQNLFENLIKYLSNKYKKSDNDFVGCKFFFATEENVLKSNDETFSTMSSQEISQKWSRTNRNNDDDTYPVYLPYMPWNKLNAETIFEMAEQAAQSDKFFDCSQSFVLELSLVHL